MIPTLSRARITAETENEEDTVHSQLVVGKRFPDLELPDHRGETVRLSKLAGEYPLIVSFYRGYW